MKQKQNIRISFLGLLGFLTFSSCQEGNPAEYNKKITEARELFVAGEYEASGEVFSEAFEATESKDSVEHHYEAARSWALAGDKDAAFDQLHKIAAEGMYADLVQISRDKTLSSLHTDERWMEILNKVSDNNRKAKEHAAERAQYTNFSLLGRTTGIEDNTYLYIRDLANGGDIDSAIVKDNMFRFDTKLPEPALYVFLFSKDRTRSAELWLENRPMTFDATSNDFKNAIVTGSENHSLSIEMKKKVYQDVREVEEEVLKQREMEFIRQHPEALVSAYILALNLNWSQDELRPLFSSLSAEVRASSLAQRTAIHLEKDLPEIGEPYLDFSVPNPQGETEKLSSLTGDLTLLQFWSSTCNASRMMNSELSELYKQYHSEGFEIIGISKDSRKEHWIRAIEEDSLSWPQLSNLQGWNGEVFRTYGINGTPSNFLIDHNGTIVARNLRGEELKRRIQEGLKK